MSEVTKPLDEFFKYKNFRSYLEDCARFRVDPMEPGAVLALYLHMRKRLAALKSKRKSPSGKACGRPRLEIDELSFIIEIDKRRQDLGQSIKAACINFRRAANITAIEVKTLIRYYDHNHQRVRASRDYFMLRADCLCWRPNCSRCFKMQDIEDCDLDALPTLCQHPEGCCYHDSAVRRVAAVSKMLDTAAEATKQVNDAAATLRQNGLAKVLRERFGATTIKK